MREHAYGHINVKVEFDKEKGKITLDKIDNRAQNYKPKERVTYKMIQIYNHTESIYFDDKRSILL